MSDCLATTLPVSDAMMSVPSDVLVVSVTQYLQVERGALMLTVAHKSRNLYSVNRIPIQEKILTSALRELREWDERYKRVVEPLEEDILSKDAQFLAIVEQLVGLFDDVNMCLANQLTSFGNPPEV